MKDQIEVEQPRSTSNSLTSCKEMTIVCFGSLADISERIRDVRFTHSGHAHHRHQRPLSANSGHGSQHDGAIGYL